MKLTKRILVAVLAVAVIASCFAFGTSAEFTEDNIEDILEFYRYPKYIVEDFDSQTEGEIYTLNTAGEGYASAEFTSNAATVVKDPSDAANKVLSYVNSVIGGQYLGYSLVIDDGSGTNEMISEFVSTVRVRADKAGANVVPAFSFNVYSYDEFGDPVGEAGLVTLLKLDFETGAVSYAKVNSSDATRFEPAPVSGFTVRAGEWYDVTLVVNCNKGTYSFKIENERSSYESREFSLGEAELVNEIRGTFSSLPSNAGSVNYIDALDIYRGTFIRGEVSRNEATAQALYDIAQYVENNNVDLKTQLRIAAVYEVITDPANGYAPTYTPDFSASVVEKLYDDAKAFIPATYTRAFLESAGAISSDRSYSRRLRQIALAESYIPLMNDEDFYLAGVNAVLDDLITDLNEEFDYLISEFDPSETEEIAALNLLREECIALIETAKTTSTDGLIPALEEKLYDYYYALNYVYDAEFLIEEESVTLNQIRSAKEAIAEERITLARVKAESELFISYMQEYDPTVRDYEAIKDIYTRVATQCAYRDNSYNYSATPNVYQYVDDFALLEAKYQGIVSAVSAFQNSVDAMYQKNPQDGSEPAFIDVYNNYLVAKSVYNGGVIHPDVDISTVSMLEIDIDRYLAKEQELNVVISVCDDFIEKVNNAKEATLYESTKTAIAAAKEALLLNGENIIDDYPGVTDAKNSIASIEDRIEGLEKAAADYIAAVDAIENDTNKGSLAHYRAIVKNARELSVTGNVVGIAGVAEANTRLSAYEAELDSYDGNSKTLVDAVAKLADEELTVSERRMLIATADSAKDKAHNDYNGVKGAKSKLAEYKEAYLAEAAAVNAAFNSAVSNASVSASSAVNQPKYSVITELIKLIFG